MRIANTLYMMDR